MNLDRAIKLAKVKLKYNQKYLNHYFAHILKIDPMDVMLHANNIILQSKHIKKLFQFIRLSNKNFPYAYIVKNMPFLNHNFYVNSHCLIPREDSATILDLIDDYIKNNYKHDLNLNILEIGVGSGCLILSLLKQHPNTLGVAIDIKRNTLKVAKKNIKLLGLSGRLTLILSDLFINLNPQKFNIIISNPPYIDKNDKNLDKYVKKYEPHNALFANDNGLYFYKEIFKNSHTYLALGGIICVEIGKDQDKDVVQIAMFYGYKLALSKKDTLNITRALLFVKLG